MKGWQKQERDIVWPSKSLLTHTHTHYKQGDSKNGSAFEAETGCHSHGPVVAQQPFVRPSRPFGFSGQSSLTLNARAPKFLGVVGGVWGALHAPACLRASMNPVKVVFNL